MEEGGDGAEVGRGVVGGVRAVWLLDGRETRQQLGLMQNRTTIQAELQWFKQKCEQLVEHF